MAECRVDLLAPEAARNAAEAAGVPAAFAELNIFRVLLHRPVAAKGIADLLVALLFRGELDHRLRELVIMRIGWATGSDYEWTQHWSIAQQRFGLSRDDLLAVRDWRRSDRFGPAERAVLEATDETLATGTLGAASWARATEHLSRDAAIELVAAIGTWRLVSQLTRSLAIPLEPGVASWPPDGAPSPAA
jgi:alkylhydroperoxidase family enzyme